MTWGGLGETQLITDTITKKGEKVLEGSPSGGKRFRQTTMRRKGAQERRGRGNV